MRACLLPPPSFLTLLETLWGWRIYKWKITPFFSSMGGNNHKPPSTESVKIKLNQIWDELNNAFEKMDKSNSICPSPRSLKLSCMHLKFKQRNPLDKPKIMKPRFRDVSPCSNECPIQNTILSSKSPEGPHLCYLSVLLAEILHLWKERGGKNIILRAKTERSLSYWEINQLIVTNKPKRKKRLFQTK